MALAGGLMLKMLPGLAPVLASGLLLGAAPRQGATPDKPAAGKQVLLIVAGLPRHIEETWPQMEQSLIVPNEEAGYSFTNFFVTNTGLACNKDSPMWKSRKCEEPTDKESNVNQSKKLFAPRKVTVLDHLGIIENNPYRYGGCHGGPEDDGDEAVIVRARYGSHENDDDTDNACSGWTWWDRVHHVLERVAHEGLGARFDRMVALRPDVVLKWAQISGRAPKTNLVEMRLEEMCEKRPGLSFVTGSWLQRGRTYLHDRDFDFMHILCPGDKLPAYEEAMRTPVKKCDHEPIPTLPPGFNSNKGWGRKALYCQFVQVLQIHNISVEHWDDSFHLGWPDRFCGSPEHSGRC